MFKRDVDLGGHQYTAKIDLLPFGNFKSVFGYYNGYDIEQMLHLLLKKNQNY